jgi:serine/threonine protein kinase
MNYLHAKGLLHRDVSLQNVLVKIFDEGSVLIKLSDLGLVKEPNSEFTRTGSEMRGTIRDPQLADFKRYGLSNEMYAIGWVLSYIFTGRDALTTATDSMGAIVRRCTAAEPSTRFQTVIELISEVERIEVPPAAVGPS